MRDATHSNLAVALLLLMLTLMFGCGSKPTRSVSAYTVKPGDTLYSIAWRHGVDYHDLARWNGIGRDYAIHPGQVLRFQAAPMHSTAKQSEKTKVLTPPSVQTPIQASSNLPPMKWQWPTKAITTALTTRPNGGQGFMLGGELGQEIRAAAAGRVVYTGSGLLGYGQLVIIKHNEVYLSAYGHTQAVRVREGDNVLAGQPIATMGAGPSGEPMLYFEIRVNGLPVNPTPLLPKQ